MRLMCLLWPNWIAQSCALVVTSIRIVLRVLGELGVKCKSWRRLVSDLRSGREVAGAIAACRATV